MDGERGPQHKKLLVHRGVSPLVLVPAYTMSTSQARSLQPPHVSTADAVFNVSRSALLIAALMQSPELLLDATADRLHQDYRAGAMPETQRLVQALRAAGFAAVVSGAGPSVLVLADGPGSRLDAVEVANRVTDTPWEALLLAVDVRGGTVGIERRAPRSIRESGPIASLARPARKPLRPKCRGWLTPSVSPCDRAQHPLCAFTLISHDL